MVEMNEGNFFAKVDRIRSVKDEEMVAEGVTSLLPSREADADRSADFSLFFSI